MKKFRVTTYRTLKGTYKFADIGDHAYGEWIIYSKEEAKFHINLFRTNSMSDKLIKDLIDIKKESVGSIIEKINSNFNMKLNFGRKPIIEVIVKTEIKELDLNPIPVEWLLTLKKRN